MECSGVVPSGRVAAIRGTMPTSKKLNFKRFIAGFPIPILLFFSNPELPFFIAGMTLVVLGEGLRVWATGHLRKNQEVVTSGPYAFVRNPLYVGTYLIGMGFCLSVSQLVSPGIYFLTIGVALGSVAYFGYYLPRKCRIETDRLERRFSAEAKRYNETVPSFLPRLTPYKGEKKPWRFHLVLENNEQGTFLAVCIGIILFSLRLILPTG